MTPFRASPFLAAVLLAGCHPTPVDEVASPRSPAPRAERQPPRDAVEVEAVQIAARHGSASPFGLTASDGTGLSLVSVITRAVVEDPIAITEVRLTFENPEARILEGRFAMTLPPGATVSRFAMRIGDAWQEGEIVEKQAARRAYEDFLHRKQDPALLEQAAGNELSARVFPIPARGRKEIVITYSEELAAGRPYALRLGGLPRIAELDVVVHEGARAHVLRRTAFTPEGDVTVPRGEGPAGLRSGNLALIRIKPVAEAEAAPLGTTVILFDTSASRALGFEAQLGTLRELVQAVVRSGGPGSQIAVVCFDQATETVFDGAASNFGDAAISAIRARGALGASDLTGAFAAASTLAGRKGARRVLLLSDGVATAGETKTVSAAILREGGVERLDAIVLGGIRDEPALRRLVTQDLPRAGVVADASAGAGELARRLGQATRTNVKVVVEGARWSWPKRLDGVQAGDEALVYADLGDAGPARVSVGDAPTRAFTLSETERPLLERSWTQARIASLVDEESRAPSEGLRSEIVSLSTRHRVLSPYTALLVLETEADYRRFNIDRRARGDILTVRGGRVDVMQRDVTAPLDMGNDSSAKADPGPRAGPSDGLRAGAADGVRARGEPAPAPAASPATAGTDAPLSARGNMWGDSSGDSFGAGGLGLSGVGEGGGGVGSLGHGAGRGFGTRGLLSGEHRAPPLPEVRIETPSVTGRMAPETVTRVVLQNQARFRECLARGPAGNRGLAGRVDARFLIDSRGAVAGAAASGIDDAGVIRCFTAVLRGMSFPVPESGTVSVAVTISVGGDKAPSVAPYVGRFKIVKELLAQRKTDDAMKEANAWHKDAPGDALSLVALGEVLEASGNVARAARAYGSIIDLFPARADLRRFAGGRLEHLSGSAGLELATDTYAKAREERPDHPSSHRLLAFSLLRKGDPAAAFKVAREGAARKYPAGRFRGVERILREDLGLIAAAYIKIEPARKQEIQDQLAEAGGVLESEPSMRFVLTWETDANDVDFHIRDAAGGHAYFGAKKLPSGGELYDDVTTGYGPECFTVRGEKSARRGPYALEAHYYARGPMGYGMGKLQIIEHDGKGGFVFEDRPFVAMVDHAYVDLGNSP